MSKEKPSRREFLKTGALGGTVLASVVTTLNIEAPAVAEQSLDRYSIIAALGDILIPSTPDPGYKTLEDYNITAEVLKHLTVLSDSDLKEFNEGSRSYFGGKPFAQLSEAEREKYLDLIIDGTSIHDSKQLRALQKVYRLTRIAVFTVYYSNYPEHIVPRDRNDVPILSPGDNHQISNPNTTRIVTGWDIAGYEPQLSWEHEQAKREKVKKMGMWSEAK